MKRSVVVALGAVIVAVLAVAAFSLSGSGTSGGTATPTAFDLPSLQGQGRVRLASFRGTPVVVTLFASWCTECRQELPDFASLSSQLRGRLQFIGVNSQETGDGPGFAAQYRLTENGFVLAKDIGRTSTGGLFKAYSARGLPVTVFYSGAGQLLFTANGAITAGTMRAKLAQYYGV